MFLFKSQFDTIEDQPIQSINRDTAFSGGKILGYFALIRLAAYFLLPKEE
jgi:hypothetical protein